MISADSVAAVPVSGDSVAAVPVSGDSVAAVPVSGDSVAAVLATSSPADLGQAAEDAIAATQTGIAAVTSGELSGLALLDAFDEAAAALANMSDQLDLIGMSHPDPLMRDAADTAKQAIAKARTEVSLNRALYDALSTLDLSEADAATRHYVTVTLREFRRAGVDRDDATRARVRALQEELVEVGQDFGRNIRSDTRSATFPPAALAGLPEDYVRAHPPAADGLVRITTEQPDFVPFLRYATDASAREQLWRLFRQRAYPSNVDVFRRLIERRHSLATLLGYPNWAEYVAENKMVGSASNISEFIERIAAAAAARSQRDYDRLLERKRVDDPDADRVHPWDSAYLDDRVKADELAFDTQSMRPYFEYTRVKAGLFALVERLFGIEFRPRPDLPRWHPDVECHEVFADGRLIGRIFLDMHPRTDKFNRAAMLTMTAGKTGKRIPECALLCNLPRPGERPALLQHSDVTTFFHEFGHLIHHILAGDSRWSGTSGVATEWDFVEAPSQLLEEWVRDAGVLATFAVHYETGEPLPAEMVAKLQAAEKFGRGLFVRHQMFYASLSLELHRSDPAELDPFAVEKQEQERLTPYSHVDGTYTFVNFGHLENYSAVYCTYMWSMVIAKDLFTVFADRGLLSTEAASRYRDTVLAPGGSAPAADLVANFLGRPYTVAAYQTWLNTD